MAKLIYIGVGGFFGAILRYLISGFVMNKIDSSFPYGTFAVNLVGCFLLGMFSELTLEHLTINPYWRTMITVGFIGAFTTFSTLSLETFMLLEDKSFLLAGANLLGSIVFGLLFVWLGVVLGRIL